MMMGQIKEESLGGNRSEKRLVRGEERSRPGPEEKSGRG
jgi:hypothetical protein